MKPRATKDPIVNLAQAVIKYSFVINETVYIDERKRKEEYLKSKFISSRTILFIQH